MAGEIEPPAGMREFLINRAAQITSEVGADLATVDGEINPQQLKNASKRLKEARRALKVARDISIIDPIELTAGREIGLPSLDEPSADTPQEPLRQKRPSIGSTQRTLVDAALKVNGTEDGFLFDNVVSDSATEQLFPEKTTKFDNLPPHQRRRKIHSLTGASYGSFRAIAGRLRSLDNPNSVDKDGINYLTEIRAAHPRFAHLSAGEIADLLERKTPFPGSQQDELGNDNPESEGANPEPEAPEQTTTPESSPSIPDNRKRKINYPIGKDQAELVIQLLLPNDTATGFLHSKDSLLRGRSNNSRGANLKVLIRRMLQQPENPHVIAFVNQIRTMHENYSTLSIPEIAALIRRDIPFPSLSETNDLDNPNQAPGEITLYPDTDPTPTTESQKSRLKIGRKEKEIAIALLTPKIDGTGFEHWRLIDALGESFRPNDRTALKRIIGKITSNPNDPAIKNLLDQIRELHPAYEDATPPQISSMLRRTSPFPGTKMPILSSPRRQIVDEPSDKPIAWKTPRRLPSAVPRPHPRSETYKLGTRRQLPPPNLRRPTISTNNIEGPRDGKPIPNPNFPPRAHSMTRGELAAYLMLFLNQDKDGFKYATPEEALSMFPKDFMNQINALHEIKRNTLITRLSTPDVATISVARFAQQLREFEIQDITKKEQNEPISNFLNWAFRNSALETFTPQELADLIERKATFSALVDAYHENPKNGFIDLNGDGKIPRRIPQGELDRLYRVVGTLPQEITRRAGIEIPQDIAKKAAEISTKEATDPQTRQEIRQATGPLVKRLRAYLSNPNSYNDQISDPEEKRILALIGILSQKPYTRDLFLRHAI